MVRGLVGGTGCGPHGGLGGVSLSVPLGLVGLHRGVVASHGQLVRGLSPVGEMHCSVIYIRDSGEFPVRHQQSALGIPECEPLSPLPPRSEERRVGKESRTREREEENSKKNDKTAQD